MTFKKKGISIAFENYHFVNYFCEFAANGSKKDIEKMKEYLQKDPKR